jgi:general secretion pathway protein L
MDLGRNSLTQAIRDVAYRAGLPRFWRWWMAELAPLVPAASRGAIRRRLTRPVIEFRDREATFLRAQVANGRVALVKVASVTLGGDATEVANAGRAAMSKLFDAQRSRGDGPLKVTVLLPAHQVLRKDLTLPAAVEENLRQTLTYELDRHTPFRPDQIYFDAVVVGRDPAKRTIRVEWVAALKTVVDGARKQVEAWGAVASAVAPLPAGPPISRLNLVPIELRSRSFLWRRWQVWAPTALIAVAALAAVSVPLMQKREYAVVLNTQMESAHQQADAADALRQRLERMQGDYNYILQKKYAYPSAVQVIDDVTKVLPDDTWVTALELKTTVKGKDTQRELALRGEAANGGKLISLLEDSKLVEQAALRSPTTKLQPGPGEISDLGALVRTLTVPGPKTVEVAAGAAAASSSATPTPTPSSSAAPAVSRGAGSPAPAPGASPTRAVPTGAAPPAAGAPPSSPPPNPPPPGASG